jgi:hypothetical protein
MDATRSLARLLAGDALAAGLRREAGPEALWSAAAAEGVDRLLAWKILEAPEPWGEALQREAAATRAQAAVVESLQRRELLRLTAALAGAPVRALVIKGAAWAYTIYPRPDLRARLDTDILIDPASRPLLDATVTGIGYRPAIETSMALASSQRHYTRTDNLSMAHHLDVHWRVTNPLAFANLLPFASLWERSVPVAALDGARTPCDADALLLACLHRIAHHGHESGLMWLYDVHLLAGRLTARDWETVRQAADGNPLAGLCARTLARCVDLYRTPLPEDARAWIDRAQTDGTDPAFLGRGVRPLGVFLADWRAAASWRVRARLVADHAFPPSSYMLARYGTRRAALLPFLYGHRALGGLRRWLALGR